MKKLLCLMGGILCLQGVQAAEPALDNDQKKISYTLGYQLAQSLRQQGFDLDAEVAAGAVRDAFSGSKPKMSQAEMEATVQAMNAALMQKKVEMAKANYEAGKKFLEENKSKEGVVALDSGLQYKVLKAGTGKSPKVSDTVVAHYEGRLLNGNVFDSSIQRGSPATFPLARVIKGWQEVVPLMKEGAKWQVYIPSDLAYGEKGAGRNIGPNETLIFDIELIRIN
ncbi:MAG: FKBP-type peptidyl-prolyl cis-trans isomerase [Granulosicoccaceae bacterium]|jgi:FKBP-type peptidyl-prolyl cis-trans isomerase FklB